MTRTHFLLASALLAVGGAPAFAEPVVIGKRALIDDEGRVTRLVSFRDLDLSSPTGEKTLIRRVGGAVRYVCSSASDFMREASCKSVAWNGARPQIARALEQARTNPALAQATLSSLTISAPSS